MDTALVTSHTIMEAVVPAATALTIEEANPYAPLFTSTEADWVYPLAPLFTTDKAWSCLYPEVVTLLEVAVESVQLDTPDASMSPSTTKVRGAQVSNHKRSIARLM